MIHAVVVVNQQGKPRIARFYDGSTFEAQQHAIRTLHRSVMERDLSKQSTIFDGSYLFGSGTKVIYRNFATLYFIVVVDEAESELSMLDLIHSFVQVLNACFESVCELDIIFNFEKVNYILDEMIIGGMVLDITFESVMDSVAKNNAFLSNTGGSTHSATSAIAAAVSRLTS